MIDHTSEEIEAEFGRCASLRWADAQRFVADGVAVMTLVHSPCCEFDFIVRDRVAFDRHGTFEFARHVRLNVETCSAYIFLARDECGDPVDMVAWRDNRIARWLGRAGLLGAEQIDVPRLGEPLVTHVGIREWLRAGRHGVVILDARQAAHALQHEHLQVESSTQARELRSLLTIPAPRISAVSTVRAAA